MYVYVCVCVCVCVCVFDCVSMCKLYVTLCVSMLSVHLEGGRLVNVAKYTVVKDCIPV